MINTMKQCGRQNYLPKKFLPFTSGIVYLLFNAHCTSNQISLPDDSYLFNNGNTRSICEIYSKLAIKTPKRRRIS